MSNVIIIGAGIFGITTALLLSENKYNVTLVDREDDIMCRASKCNHNRLHFGFHYPRSIKTAKQSLDGYDLFYKNFSNSIIDFPNYYLIERNGRVSSSYFESFCNDLGVFHEKGNPPIDVNMENISLSLLTKEKIFDFESIRIDLYNRLKSSKVNLILNKDIDNISDLNDFDTVINTTYSNINKINKILDIDPINLKLQDVIVPIFRMNYDKIGITVMDGEYCSIMPKGFEENTFLLYHVKKSVIKQVIDYEVPHNWIDNDIKFISDRIDDIYESSSIYYPFLKNCERVSFWRTNRALAINDDDERLSTIKYSKAHDKKVISLLSGKITTCWLMSEKILKLLNEDNINW